MPKEIDEVNNSKPKTTRARRPRTATAAGVSLTGGEVVQTRRRTTRRVATAEAVSVSASGVTRKAPTRDLSETKSGGIKVSRQWYVLAALLLAILGGSVYIGHQDQGAINVDALMVKERQALIAAEEERQRILRESSQAAVIEALSETASSTATSTDGVTSTSTEAVEAATSTAPVEEPSPQAESGESTNDQP